MDVLSVKKSSAELNITENELLILNAALNEISNGIHISEFETRMGSGKEEVNVLLKQVSEILDEISTR